MRGTPISHKFGPQCPPKMWATTTNIPQMWATTTNIPQMWATATNVPQIWATTTNILQVWATTSAHYVGHYYYVLSHKCEPLLPLSHKCGPLLPLSHKCGLILPVLELIRSLNYLDFNQLVCSRYTGTVVGTYYDLVMVLVTLT